MADRKGLSELVSYVLLIVIAVGLSVVVYNYLSAYVPKDKPTCGEDISVIVQDAWCNAGNPGRVNVTMLNKGLFKIDAVYIRFGPADRKINDLINEKDLYFSKLISSSSSGLMPGSSASKEVSVTNAQTPGTYTLQVEPAVFNNNDLALCPGAIVTQSVSCK